MNSIQGLTAMITGAGSGIGKAICLALAQQGCNICALGRSEEKLQDTVQKCSQEGVKAIHFTLDLSNTKSLTDAVENCANQLGGLNILVNAGGIGGNSDNSMEYLEKYIDVNLISLMKLTKLSLPHIEKGPLGAVINVNTDESRCAEQNHTPFCAAKFGVLGFSASLFEDVREKGIKVCAIEPGLVSNHTQLSSNKYVQPEDIAKTVLFVVMFGTSACPTEIYLNCQRDPYNEKESEESH